MFSAVKTAIISGMKAIGVTVEADVSNGLPCFDMVGDLNSQVKEAKERVRTAIKNSGFSLLAKKQVINICPADIRKEGSTMDLAIAIAVLVGHGLLPQECVKDYLFAGELGLDGKVNSINGAMPIIACAKEMGVTKCIIPKSNEAEGTVIDGVLVYCVQNLKEAFEFLIGNEVLQPIQCKANELFNQAGKENCDDFAELNGQVTLKRACEIAAAGMHNLLMIGPPGSGKTMAARRIPGILPSISLNEAIEISSLYSVNGMLASGEGLIAKRPFREVHHTVTKTAMVGGMRRAGEVSLADKGVLFLDEFPEFDRSVLETLRQPLESGKVNISKGYVHHEYPADFMLVAAMNPCKCGFYPDLNKCRCTAGEIRRYLSRVSGPLLDRIDICTETSKIQYDDITSTCLNESSENIRKRVEEAHQIQKERFKSRNYHFNSKMTSTDVKRFCPLDKETKEYMEMAFDKLDLSARTYNKTLKVSRTIADLSGSENVQLLHIKEALFFRGLDKKYMEV